MEKQGQEKDKVVVGVRIWLRLCIAELPKERQEGRK